ncbi:glycosyltransferase family 9 protein [Polynucleobacter ibericus]|uniref:glycosyltransferase family 9 protein n=1 Tax=Polynucleobacter ibericus TaxID=1819725 RepID=UPI001BFD0FCF|nr:glycosyltransferase family 9 protein [Polynucleobacter ibericus]QWE08951.1 glycosyltransferase family 9 protein [Polynucleobacter ibericus]
MSLIPLNATVCILSARRFGDAIMNASNLKLASQARPDIKWIIWTKPEFSLLFKLMGFDNLITAEFPIAGGFPKIIKGGWIDLIQSTIQLRKMKIDVSFDFIGDTRESFLGTLIGSRVHYSPKWAPSHWMHHLIWRMQIPGVNYLSVKPNDHQVYEFIPALLSELVGSKLSAPIKPSLKKLAFDTSPKIAFHPYSSQAFKKWPNQHWLKLAQLLSQYAITPSTLCSSSEESEARDQFGSSIPTVHIAPSESLEQLIAEIKKFDLLIGVDSFLVHLASALGKKTIVINAGNLPQWWAPPNSVAIGQSGGCTYYPCFNEPKCIGKITESACIKSITPEQIIAAIEFDSTIHMGRE